MNPDDRTTRREFLKKSAGFTAGAAAASLLGPEAHVFAGNPPDLVAVKNGEPAALFDRAIAAMGGMKKYVKKNQTVVVKPNIGWQREPATGANTNPMLVRRIIEHVKDAGARKIYVFDHTVDWFEGCYRKSGIAEAAKSAGAMVVPGDSERYYQEVAIPGAGKLKTTKVHELILESDLYINVPVLKHHASTGLTMAMKNQMGVVYDRRYFHRHDLHRCIADLCLAVRPDLNIMDAYRVTLRGGPQRARKEDLALMKSLMISQDIVALDAAATMLFGKKPASINHILHAHKSGVGNMNLNELSIKKIDIAG